ncbi:hypothetical protein [Neobacillus soli]|uniref:hypothetical protein n=1 Tax=Neobacillus soli TaxID=220688 RepID=UPI000ADCF667|nr:hypothetical protein [Neobacillus soli]
MIIVKEITEENIRKALATYIENSGYWLKLYFLAGEFEFNTLENMVKKINVANEEV